MLRMTQKSVGIKESFLKSLQTRFQVRPIDFNSICREFVRSHDGRPVWVFADGETILGKFRDSAASEKPWKID
jgi:hypothetical protein